MLTKVHRCGLDNSGIVSEKTDGMVALLAQEPAHFIRLVVVVHGERQRTLVDRVLTALRLFADGADSALRVQHRRIDLGRDAVLTFEIAAPKPLF
jgi:hypothetical protein